MKRKKRGLEDLEPVEFYAELRVVTDVGYFFTDGRHRINLLKEQVIKLIPISGSRKNEYTIVIPRHIAIKKGII